MVDIVLVYFGIWKALFIKAKLEEMNESIPHQKITNEFLNIPDLFFFWKTMVFFLLAFDSDLTPH